MSNCSPRQQPRQRLPFWQRYQQYHINQTIRRLYAAATACEAASELGFLDNRSLDACLRLETDLRALAREVQNQRPKP